MNGATSDEPLGNQRPFRPPKRRKHSLLEYQLLEYQKPLQK